ncbi:MAG: hypothetical protein GY754_01105 [bacterium]|nr:hypothetical protein [bacterium]
MKRIEIENPHNIKIEYYTLDADADDIDTLIIACKGICGSGSDSNEDAQYIYAMGEAGVCFFEPSMVILDFSELEYHWGDRMDIPFNIGASIFYDEEAPFALVVGPKCKDAIDTLIADTHEPADPLENEWVFDTIEEAVKFVRDQYDNIRRAK